MKALPTAAQACALCAVRIWNVNRKCELTLLMRPVFVVEYRGGRWRMNVDGECYGSFPTRASAQLTATQLAQAAATLSPQVVLRANDDFDEIIWDAFSLIENLWQNLRGKMYCPHTGSADAQALLEEIARRVQECAEFELSAEETIDVVLASFGTRRRLH
jgi:hypothetical protein